MGGPGSGRRADPGRLRRAAKLRARGLSLAQVGRELGVSKQAVAKLLRRAGVPDPGHVRCAACGVAVARPALWAPRPPTVLCLACLATRLDLPFGQRLTAHRLAVGLTQAELARRAGLSEGTICRYERGRARPQAETSARLARVLGQGLGCGAGGFFVDPHHPTRQTGHG